MARLLVTYHHNTPHTTHLYPDTVLGAWHRLYDDLLFCVDSGIGGQSQGVLREESQNRYISNFKSLFAIYLYLLNYMIPGDKRRRYICLFQVC